MTLMLLDLLSVFFLYFLFFFHYMYVCVAACLYVHHMVYTCLQRPEEGVTFPGAGVKGGRLPHRGLGTELGSSAGQ